MLLQQFVLPIILGIIGAAIPIVPVLYRTIKGQRALLKKLEAQAALIEQQARKADADADITVVEAARNAYTLLQESYQNVERRLDAYNAQIGALTNERDAAQTALTALQKEVAQLRAALSAESTQVASLREELANMAASRGLEQEGLVRARAGLTEVLAQREQQALRIRRLESDYQRSNQRVQALQKRVAALERENADALERISQLEAENAHLRGK